MTGSGTWTAVVRPPLVKLPEPEIGRLRRALAAGGLSPAQPSALAAE